VTPVADAPTLAAIAVSGTEDTTLTFTAENFTGAYLDPENTALVSITVVTLPATGTLKLLNVNVTASQVIALANLPNVTYVPAADANGVKTFTVTASDGALLSAAATVSMTLAAANDAPVASGTATLAAVAEDIGTAAPGATVTDLFGANFSDARDGSAASALGGVAVTTHTINLVSGEWQYSVDGTTWIALPTASSAVAFTLKASDRLRFVPAANYQGLATPLAVNVIEAGVTPLTSATVLNLAGAAPQLSLSTSAVIGWSSMYSTSFAPTAGAE
jgi:VCBS repeat-containing protein